MTSARSATHCSRRWPAVASAKCPEIEATRNSAGPDDAPDTAPDQHARPRHVAPLRTANDRTARFGLERPDGGRISYQPSRSLQECVWTTIRLCGEGLGRV